MGKEHLRIFSRRDLRHETIFEAEVSEEIAFEPFFKHPDDRKKGIYSCIAETRLSLAQFARLKQNLLWAIKREFDQDTRKRLWKAILSEPLNKANFATLEKIFIYRHKKGKKQSYDWSQTKTGYSEQEREQAEKKNLLLKLLKQKDPYEVLNIPSDSTIDEIKRAHKKLAFKFHPDQSSTPDIEKFTLVTEAYSRLREIKGF